MHIIVKGAKTISEYIAEKQRIKKLAKLAYERHKKFCSEWKEGLPVKAYSFDFCDVCVEYESGNRFYYKDLDLPFPTIL